MGRKRIRVCLIVRLRVGDSDWLFQCLLCCTDGNGYTLGNAGNKETWTVCDNFREPVVLSTHLKGGRDYELFIEQLSSSYHLLIFKQNNNEDTPTENVEEESLISVQWAIWRKILPYTMPVHGRWEKVLRFQMHGMKVTRYTEKQDVMAHEQNVPTKTDPKSMMVHEVSD